MPYTSIKCVISYLKLPEKPTLDHERSEILQQLEDWLEMPRLVLGFAWLGLFIIELVWGLNPLLEAIAFCQRMFEK